MTDQADYLNELARCRGEIDAIDDALVELLNKRTASVISVGKLKADNEPKTGSFYRPDREAAILRRLADKNQGPMQTDALLAIFRELISQSLSLEQRQKVAYLGPEGTFTEQAALKHFGSAPEFFPCANFEEIFRNTEHGTVDWGVVPIENSTEGAVSRVLDFLVDSPLKIAAEVLLPIRQNLLCLHSDLDKIHTVYSHQQSFSQCYHWLNANLPHAERVAVSSNGEAAKMASMDPNVCAIAGEVAQKRYPTLQICRRHIEDESNNTTRFVILGHDDALPTGNDKTTLIVGIENRVGSMYEMIEPIARYGISMTHIESRPAKKGLGGGIWEYVFFIHLLGHHLDPQVAMALDEIRETAGFVKILGGYPQAIG